MEWETRGNEVLQDFIRGMLTAIEKEDSLEDEDARVEYIGNEVLSVEKRIHYEVTLEYGGPTSWIDFECREKSYPSDDSKPHLYGATFKSRWGGHPPIDIVLKTEDAQMLYGALGLEYFS